MEFVHRKMENMSELEWRVKGTGNRGGWKELFGYIYGYFREIWKYLIISAYFHIFVNIPTSCKASQLKFVLKSKVERMARKNWQVGRVGAMNGWGEAGQVAREVGKVYKNRWECWQEKWEKLGKFTKRMVIEAIIRKMNAKIIAK